MQNEQDAHADAQQQRSVRCLIASIIFPPFGHPFSRMRMRFFRARRQGRGPPLRCERRTGPARIRAA